jgi:cell division protein FtsB
MKSELTHLQAEHRRWEHRVSLLRSDRIDPDMLDERVRAMLDYVDPKEIVMLTPRR